MIPFNYALRRRLMGSQIIPWIEYTATDQWGTGTTKTIDIQLNAGQVIEFYYHYHDDDRTYRYDKNTYGKMRYELYNGSTKVLTYDTTIGREMIAIPSAITRVDVTSRISRPSSSYSTTLHVDAYYRAY